MSKHRLISLVGKFTHQRIKKQMDKEPLYKPLLVEVDGINLPDGLIDTCQYIHKAMIKVLARADTDLSKIEKLEADNSRDYAAAIILQWYFTTWLQDVKSMHQMTDGGE